VALKKFGKTTLKTGNRKNVVDRKNDDPNPILTASIEQKQFPKPALKIYFP
jgi:hypothetical protein